MKQGAPMRQLMTALALERAITMYSTKKNDNGISVPYEVLDGLRVLGAPISSTNFCNTFIDNAMYGAKSDALKLVQDLEDLQMTLRLYSICTAHKVTHLFGHAVYNTHLDDLPTNFWLWESPMTSKFGNMTSDLIAHVTNLKDLPPHAQIMANISIKEGGLGIQNPCTNAITTYMTMTKSCLQYAQEGFWLGFNKNRPQFLPTVKLLYQDWESSQNRSWVIFRKYLHSFNNISVNRPESPTTYIYKASLNASRKKMKE
jgi:hypothetical protein